MNSGNPIACPYASKKRAEAHRPDRSKPADDARPEAARGQALFHRPGGRLLAEIPPPGTYRFRLGGFGPADCPPRQSGPPRAGWQRRRSWPIIRAGAVLGGFLAGNRLGANAVTGILVSGRIAGGNAAASNRRNRSSRHKSRAAARFFGAAASFFDDGVVPMGKGRPRQGRNRPPPSGPTAVPRFTA